MQDLTPTPGLAGLATGTTLYVDGGNHAAGSWRRRGDGGFEPA